MHELLAVVGLDDPAPAVVRRLLATGHRVSVHDRRRSLPELSGLAELGARPSLLPADAAAGADLVLLLAADDAVAEEFLFDHGGVTETLPAGAVVVDARVLPADRSRATSARLARYGLDRVELIGLGGDDDAAAGRLLLLLGGPAPATGAAAVVLSALGEVWHLGPTGVTPTVEGLLREALAMARLSGAAAADADAAARVGRGLVRSAALLCGHRVPGAWQARRGGA